MSWTELPFKEAVRHLRSRTPMTAKQFARASEAARARAFTASRIMKLEHLQRTHDAVVKTFARGGTVEEMASRLADLDLTPGYLESIFRTNIQTAYGAGRYEQMQELGSDAWGWRYDAVDDDRTREEHAALDGHVFEGDDGKEVWPPWDFNCRCEAEIITVDEAEAEGLIPSGPLPEGVSNAVRETDFDSPALRREMEVDTSKYAKEFVEAYGRDR